MTPVLSLLRCTVAAACLALAPQLHAQSVAFTFDDGPTLSETPRLSPQARNGAMLAALARHKVRAALFVTCGNGADRPEGLALTRAWGQAGHMVANHTMTHPDLNNAKTQLAQYQQEVRDCDRIVSALPGYQKWFRYTYLREGNTPEKRDGMKAFLREQGYRNAYVTLDTSDWRLNDKLVEVLAKNPQANVEPIRQAYLSHIRQRALAYRALSQRLQGRDIAQVLLLHHNLINALWLDDVIRQFRDMGWTIVSPGEAFADPVYALDPQRNAPGQSLLISMGRSLGMTTQDIGLRLMDDGDFEIEALKQQGL
ncbi:MAG: polysaccharide deacetylase family protein [Pseudomonadota bacterium]